MRIATPRRKLVCPPAASPARPAPLRLPPLLPRARQFNHFPGSWALGRKDSLAKNVNVMKRKHGSAMNILPASYIIPRDQAAFQRAVKAKEFVSAPKLHRSPLADSSA